MKWNLRNFPDSEDRACSIWVSEFEKELRNRLKKIEKEDDKYREYSLGNATQIVKEILGGC